MAILSLAACLPVSAGLKASYFSGRNFDTPVLERIEDRIEHRWEDQSPDPAVPVNEFSARWQGFVTPAFSGEYTLYVVADNGARLKLNGQVVTDHFNPADGQESGWFDGSYTFTAGQKVALEIEYYESSGGAEITLYWESADQLFEVVPGSALTPPSDPTPPVPVGWTTRYFDGRQFEKPVLTRAETGIEYDWTGAPLPELFPDNFSVKWSGQLTPSYTGLYTFTIAADNGTRLWINGQLVSHAWNVLGGEDTGWFSAEVPLVAGQPVPILLDYYQTWGSASVALYWSSADQPWEVVPGSAISALPANTPPWLAGFPTTETIAGTDIELPIQATDATGAPLSYTAGGLPPGVTLAVQSWPGQNPRDLPELQTVSLAGRPWEPGVYNVTLAAESTSGTANTNFTWKVTGPAVDPGPEAAIAHVQTNLMIQQNGNPDRVTLFCILPSGITSFYRIDLERSHDLTTWENRTAETSFFPIPNTPESLKSETGLFYEEALGVPGAAGRTSYRIRLTPNLTVMTSRTAPPIRKLPAAPSP